MTFTSMSQMCRHSLRTADCSICKDLLVEAELELITGTENQGGMSVPDDTMDSMVQQASTPSLATLFKRGKEAGLIQATTGYGENAGS